MDDKENIDYLSGKKVDSRWLLDMPPPLQQHNKQQNIKKELISYKLLWCILMFFCGFATGVLLFYLLARSFLN